MATVIVDRRWCWTADRTRLVSETSTDAAWLAYIPGDEVNEDEARKVGLLPTPAPEPAPEPSTGDPDPKAMDKPADKARRAAPNKAGSHQ